MMRLRFQLYRPILVLAVGVSVAAGAHAQARDPTVTSDTPEYCEFLMTRISGLVHGAHTPPPTEAAMLSEEGERMCEHGQTRGGIMRLRQAIVILGRPVEEAR